MGRRDEQARHEQARHERARGAGSRLTRLFVPLAGTLSLLLVGCSVGQTPGTSLAANQSFTWPYTGTTKISYDMVLDPASVSNLADGQQVPALFVGLLNMGSNMQVQPDAAAALPTVEDSGKVYTFKLRPNMKFSDGTSIAAEDFAYSIDRSLDPHLCDRLDASTYGDPAVGTCDNYAATYLGPTGARVLGSGDRLSGKIPTMIGTTDDGSHGLIVVDPLTLKIRLDKPAAFFLQALTYVSAYVVEKAFVEKYPGGKWVDHLDQGGCSGPFKVGSYGDGSQITMVANPYWADAWGKKIGLAKIVRPLVQTADEAYKNYQQGQYDYVGVPGVNYNTARGQGDFVELESLTTRYFGMNLRLPPFQNTGITVTVGTEQMDTGEAIRRAFMLTLNRQLLVDSNYNGGAIPTYHIIPKPMLGYFPNLKTPLPDGSQAVTGNQIAAKEVLKAAQVTCPTGTTFYDTKHQYCPYIVGSNLKEIGVWVRNHDATQISVTKDAAAQWRNTLGLNVVDHEIDRPTFGKVVNQMAKDPAKLSSQYLIWDYGWAADYPDPQDWLSVFFPTGATYNAFGFSDTTVDQKLASADVELDATKRTQLYNQAEQYILDKAVFIPFQQDKIYWRVRPWVIPSGFGFGSLQVANDTTWASVAILDH